MICSIRKDALQAMDNHWIYCNSTKEDKSVCQEDREAIGHILCALAASLVEGNLIFEERESLQNLSYQYQLLAILAKYKKKTDVKKTRHETLVSGIVRYIHEHMAEELGAEILAENFHVSQSTVYRLFYKEMGVSPKEYQRDHPVITTPYLLHQPDIMKLNQFQNFWETGYGAEVLESM